MADTGPCQEVCFTCIIVLLLICFYGVFVSNYVSRTEEYALFFGKETYRLGSMFMLGAILYLARHRIILSHLIMAVIQVGIAISSFYRPIFVPLTWACLGYLVLYFAYIPKGSIRAFNRVGDYSYGIYIFGYPTQQAVAQTVPDLPLVPFFVISFTATLLLAAMSWHWVEICPFLQITNNPNTPKAIVFRPVGGQFQIKTW